MGHCAEKKAAEKALRQSRIRGSLIGGAAGDALGYTIEFQSEETIRKQYGVNGITEYAVDNENNSKALISDDTQMTLFTACGILIAETGYQACESHGSPSDCMRSTYLDWLETQGLTQNTGNNGMRSEHDTAVTEQPEYLSRVPRAWITDIPELRHRRAPGNTCLEALSSVQEGSLLEPINNSKGCGGIMRIAPYGLYYSGPHDPQVVSNDDKEDKSAADFADNYGEDRYNFLLEDVAESVAITHGHPLGYLPSVAFVHIIHEIMSNQVNSAQDLAQAAREACKRCREVFPSDIYDIDSSNFEELERINELAIELGLGPDSGNIRQIGEGWVGEEAYGIALYCCLKYYGNFSDTIRAAVNHGGDSNSTGAIAGNIMGAIVGYEAIDDVWKSELELRDVILELADDLAKGPKSNGLGTTDYWADRYLHGKGTENEQN